MGRLVVRTDNFQLSFKLIEKLRAKSLDFMVIDIKKPVPSGITGFNPGIATSSLALGGGVCGGEISAVMNAITINRPTISIEKTQTQRNISP
ncbi:hypothetical protein OA314_00905 [bacterium]|nr:hypothetical protein [bacterium]